VTHISPQVSPRLNETFAGCGGLEGGFGGSWGEGGTHARSEQTERVFSEAGTISGALKKRAGKD